MNSKYVLVSVMLFSLIVLTSGVKAVLWADPAGEAMGWYNFPNEFNIRPLAANDNTNDDGLFSNLTKIGNAAGDYCLGTSQAAGAAEKTSASAYVFKSGFTAESIYTLRFTGLAQGTGDNFTVSVMDNMGTWVNYSNISFDSAVGWYSNTTTIIRDGGNNGLGIPAYVNDSGDLSFYIYANMSGTGLGYYLCFAALNVTNHTAANEDIEYITIKSPENTSYFENNFTVNFTAVSGIYTTFPCWMEIDGNNTFIGNVTNATSWQNITQNGTGLHNLTVICGFANNKTNESIFTTWVSKNFAQLTADPDWTVSEGTSVTVNCSAWNGTATLARDGIPVSNPYTASLSYGTYNMSCTSQSNYTHSGITNYTTLTVGTGGFACFNQTTYIWEQDFSVNNSVTNITIYLQDFYDDGIVSHDLHDVYFTNSTNMTVWRNQTSIIVNTTYAKQFKMRFGNYFSNQTYDIGTTSGFVYLVDNYSEINNYVKLSMNLEKTGVSGLPPYSNISMSFGCSLGVSSQDNITNTTLYVPTFDDKFDYVKVFALYYDGSGYFRQYLIGSPVEEQVVYMADAVERTVVQIPLFITDNNYYSSYVTVYKQIGGSSAVITEGFFDVQHLFTTYLIKDETYLIRITTGAEVREIGFLYATASGTQTISIATLETQPDITLINDNLLLGFSMDVPTASIQVTYEDKTNKTTSVRIKIRENLSQSWIYDNTFVGINDFAVTINGINTTSRYTVMFEIEHEEFGNSPLYQVLTAGALPAVFDLGFGATNWILGAFGFIITFFVAMMATPRRRLGVQVFLGMIMIFMFTFGWYNFSNTGDTTGMAFGGLALIMLILSILYEIKRSGDV